MTTLLDGVRCGRSAALVVLGEAGVGKTALLDYAVESAADLRVARAVGVESESELAFAALHQLCGPWLGRLEKLPDPQREALGTAFGLTLGPAPDRFLIGLAVLSLLSEVAEKRPLLCVVDDAQWLDDASAQVLAFVARRLMAESVLMVFGARYPTAELSGLSELVVEGLPLSDARDLLAAAVRWPLDERVRERIIAETRGNPLALLELPRGLSPAQLAGGFGLPDVLPLSGRIEESFLRRVDTLPDQARQLLVLAAADPVGDPALLWRAADWLGIPTDAAAAADAGLVEFGVAVRFRHPLVRSAVYRAASVAARREAHAALAEATDPEIDPDRRAWHAAQATAGPDEHVAAELERSAGRAQTRGGVAAAAAFLQRSAELTVDLGVRARRALAAAQAKHQAGAPDAALALLALAEAGPLDERQRAQVDLQRGQLAFASSHGRDAAGLLIAAAKRLEPLDPALARDTYLDALSAAMLVGHLAGEVGLSEVAIAALAGPPSQGRPADLLLDGLARVVAEGYAAGAPLLKQAVGSFRTAEMPAQEAIRWLWLATHAAHDLWDDEAWDELSARQVRLAREAGALTILPIALSARIGFHLVAGELGMAASLVEEVAAVTAATGSGLPPYGALALAALQGREAQATALIRATHEELVPRGEGMGLTLVQYSTALLYNGLGRYQEALIGAKQGAAHRRKLGFWIWSLTELVEAAVRTGAEATATEALELLAHTTRPTATDWALGLEARSRALVKEGEAAETCYREAIERLAHTRIRTELARAHLLYGEWLRRENRRADARQELRRAHEMLTEMGLEGFAQRARQELMATGETVRKRKVETAIDLTAQEAQVARLARDGLSNPEISTQLFISARTVEWHLGKVFTKLGITSRRQLRSALPVSGG